MKTQSHKRQRGRETVERETDGQTDTLTQSQRDIKSKRHKVEETKGQRERKPKRQKEK